MPSGAPQNPSDANQTDFGEPDATQIFIIDVSGKGGLAPNFWGEIDRTSSSPNHRIRSLHTYRDALFTYQGSTGVMAEGVYNPFRRIKHLSPANNAFRNLYGPGASDYQQQNWLSSHYDPAVDRYYFGSQLRFVLTGIGIDSQTNDSTIDLGASGSPAITDIDVYMVNGVPKTFFVYTVTHDAVDPEVDIAISDRPYNALSQDKTWLTATVANHFTDQDVGVTNGIVTKPFMRVCDNGFAYLFMDNQVHKIDGTAATGGTNGTLTPNILLFPVNFKITDAVDQRGSLYIAVNENTTPGARSNAGHCGVAVWDRTSTTGAKDYIRIPGVTDIKRLYVAHDGTLRAICTDSEGIVAMYEYDGTYFNPLMKLGPNAYPFVLDSLAVTSNYTIWAAADGYIYANGTSEIGEPEGFFRIGQIDSAGSSSQIGPIIFGGDTAFTGTGGEKSYRIGLLVTYTDNISGDTFVKIWDMYGTGASGATGVQHTAPIYSEIRFMPQMSTIQHIDLFMIPSTLADSSTAATVSIYFNQSTTSWADKIVTFADCAKGYKRIEVNKQYVNAIQFKFTYPGSNISSVDEFAPSVAVVTHLATTTKG